MFTKILSKFIFIIFFLLVIFFSIANSDNISIGIWPMDDRIEIPLFFLTIVSITIGVFVGMFLSIYARIRRR